MLRNRIGQFVVTVSLAVLPLAACGHSHTDQASGDVATPANTASPAPNTGAAAATAPVDTTETKHHSKLAGAAVGAVIGHELGHHALAGAAAGALIQHERNKRP